jgi:Aldo/keto reductase family
LSAKQFDHPLSAVQIEYSLWTRDVEAEILPLCEELGIGFVAYSPLGCGFLTSKVGDIAALRAGDARRNMPRFQGDNLRRNLTLVEELKAHAAAENCTPAQLALAWVLTRAPHIVPIPGTSHPPPAGRKCRRRGAKDLGRYRRRAAASVRAGRGEWAALPREPPRASGDLTRTGPTSSGTSPSRATGKVEQWER